jgi:DNA-binding NarL/FixJ family response regulator
MEGAGLARQRCGLEEANESVGHLNMTPARRQWGTMETIKILIADDNATFRERLREFLASEPDIEVVGEAADGQQVLLKARELQPDVVLMDVRMPQMNGLETTRLLKDDMPGVQVIMLSLFNVQEYREAARARGASGYVIKKHLVEELLPAIRRVRKTKPTRRKE